MIFFLAANVLKITKNRSKFAEFANEAEISAACRNFVARTRLKERCFSAKRNPCSALLFQRR